MAIFEDIPPVRGGDEWTPRSPSKKNKRTRASELFPEAQEMQERAPKSRRFTKAEQHSPYHSSDEDSVEKSTLRKRPKGERIIEEDDLTSRRLYETLESLQPEQIHNIIRNNVGILYGENTKEIIRKESGKYLNE